MKSKYTFELLNPIVQSSYSLGVVLDKLGLKRTGGNYTNISSHIAYLNIDKSHFKGLGWSKGLTENTSDKVRCSSEKRRIPNDEIFINNSTPINGVRLSKRMRYLGITYKCSLCELDRWLDKPITLHVDHINGKHSDNRVENLRFLCPNCHQQTDTWGGKNLTYKAISNIKECKLSKPRPTKIEWPNTEELKNLIWKHTMTELSSILNISDRAISKRCKLLNIEKPPIGYWVRK